MSLPSTRALFGSLDDSAPATAGPSSPGASDFGVGRPPFPRRSVEGSPRPLRRFVPYYACASSRFPDEPTRGGDSGIEHGTPLVRSTRSTATHRASPGAAEEAALDALAPDPDSAASDYPADAEIAARLAAFDRSLQDAVTLSALGNSALLPLNAVLSACGISRDVGERLRESGELQPVVVKDSKNPRLYVTLGAWRRFVENRSVAPPPSKSKLSKAKRSAQRDT